MKNKSTIILYLLLAACLTGCGQKKTTPMNEQTNFGWSCSVTAPQEYPVSVHTGYLAAADHFITGFGKIDVEDNGWNSEGSGEGGGSGIPAKLSVTWVSYAEKKFWKVDAVLDTVKILALFREGFMFTDRKGVTSHVTYHAITVGVAPGGVVVVWLAGNFHRTEVGRYQAKETFVDVNEFLEGLNPQNLTQQQFYESGYVDNVPDSIRKIIKERGIPFGLWDDYRIKYNWRFKVLFYKEDKEVYRQIVYLNGEEEITKDGTLDNFQLKPLPWRADLNFTEKWAETEFNDEELLAAFKSIAATHKDEPIEIVGKVGFVYNDMTFTVKCGSTEIPLKKVKVSLWNNK